MNNENYNDNYLKLIEDPLNIIGDMSYDEYVDWLELGTRKELESCLEYFLKCKLPDFYIEVLKIKLNRYN